ALRGVEARSQSATAEVEQLQAKLAERDAALEKQGGAVAELTGLNAELTKERDGLLARTVQLQDSLQQTEAALAALRTEATRLRTSDALVDNLQKELEETRRKVAEAEQRVQLRTAAES